MPAIWLLRRSRETLGAATGLGTARGLPQGVLIAFAWVGVMALSSCSCRALIVEQRQVQAAQA